MGAATGKAGDAAAYRADTWNLESTGGTAVEVAAGYLAAGEREIVAPGFIVQAEVAAGVPPLGAVGLDAPPGAGSGDEVGELVAQGAVDLGFAEGADAGIEGDAGVAVVGEAGGGAHAGVPEDFDGIRENVAADGMEEVAGALEPVDGGEGRRYG